MLSFHRPSRPNPRSARQDGFRVAQVPRSSRWRGVLGLALGLALGLGAGPTLGQGTPPGIRVPVRPPPPSAEERARFFAASKDIGCMTRQVTQPSEISRLTRQIYQRHRFQPVSRYAEVLELLSQEKAARQRLAEDLKACP